jgi:hypothetical protein
MAIAHRLNIVPQNLTPAHTTLTTCTTELAALYLESGCHDFTLTNFSTILRIRILRARP